MAEDSNAELNRPQMYLFGCELKSDKKEYKIETDDDDETEHQLSLKAVCLGAEAEDRFHTVEIEGLTFEGKTTKVQLAVLRPSILPSMSLGGFEITPPVTFRLKSGSGPIYISGQHFVSVKESDEEEEGEEENNTSPVKRPSSSGKLPMPKKIKLDEEEDEDEDDDDEDEDDDDDDDADDDDDDEDDEEEDVHEKKLKNVSIKTPNKSAEVQAKKPKAASKQNGSPGKSAGPVVKVETKSPKGGKEKEAVSSAKALSVGAVKSRLTTVIKEGKPLPKTEQKFENFARSSFKISDKNVIKELWTFVQTLKSEKK